MEMESYLLWRNEMTETKLVEMVEILNAILSLTLLVRHFRESHLIESQLEEMEH